MGFPGTGQFLQECGSPAAVGRGRVLARLTEKRWTPLPKSEGRKPLTSPQLHISVTDTGPTALARADAVRSQGGRAERVEDQLGTGLKTQNETGRLGETLFPGASDDKAFGRLTGG